MMCISSRSTGIAFSRSQEGLRLRLLAFRPWSQVCKSSSFKEMRRGYRDLALS